MEEGRQEEDQHKWCWNRMMMTGGYGKKEERPNSERSGDAQQLNLPQKKEAEEADRHDMCYCDQNNCYSLWYGPCHSL